MKVIGWISHNDLEDGFEESFGSLGGFFKLGMRWTDYLEVWPPEGGEYAEALRKEILKIKLQCEGPDHQNCRIPVFSDGTYALFSFRAWGDLMAAVWSEYENTDYSYLEWAF